jgi:hypothetical protein
MWKFSIGEAIYSIIDLGLAVRATLPSGGKIVCAAIAGVGFLVEFVDMAVRLREERRGGLVKAWGMRPNELGRLCMVLSYVTPIVGFIGFGITLAAPGFYFPRCHPLKLSQLLNFYHDSSYKRP